MITLNRLDGSFEIPDELPVIALRDLVYFPYMVLPLLIGRRPSVAALEQAEAGGGFALLVGQRDPGVRNPARGDLYRAGTVIRIVQVSHLADGTARVVMEGLGRARIAEHLPAGDGFRAAVELLAECEYEVEPSADPALAARAAEIAEMFGRYARLSDRIPDALPEAISKIGDRIRLSHLVAGHLLVGTAEKQELLEATDVGASLGMLRSILAREIEVLEIQRKLDEQIGFQMEPEGGGAGPEAGRGFEERRPADGGIDPEWAELEDAIAETPLSDEARSRAEREFARLRRMNPVAPEAAVIRTYLDWILALPWEAETRDSLDVERAAGVLEEEHYGLDEVKERILDHIAVLSLVGRLQGPILCLAGPPGVGKTSLGRSIARCLDRKFVRVSLGGVRDEAEIRGHRRTYVGALPGRIVQGMRRSGSRNPVFLLDEVDKLARDFHGDPGAALLEVLDPEQNRTFTDHYLELEFDLSNVLFIATANTLAEMPGPLRDRMEVIRLPGYLDTEKRAIARQFLWPKQLDRHGLARQAPRIVDEAIQTIVTEYTREAGVRELERRLSRVARKLARRASEAGSELPALVDAGQVRELLGPPVHLPPSRESGSGPRRDRLRAGLDGRRRRGARGGGRGGAGVGQDPADGHAGRGDEGVGVRSGDLRALAGALAGSGGAVPPRGGHPHPHPRGGHAQGRAVGGDHDRGGADLGPDRDAHARRSGDDRRDHAAGPGAGRGRDQGEGRGGAARRNQEDAASGAERGGPGAAARRGARRGPDGAGGDDGPGAQGGAGLAARGGACRAGARARLGQPAGHLRSRPVLIRSVEFAGSVVAPDQPPPSALPQIAFAGRSNVASRR